MIPDCVGRNLGKTFSDYGQRNAVARKNMTSLESNLSRMGMEGEDQDEPRNYKINGCCNG